MEIVKKKLHKSSGLISRNRRGLFVAALALVFFAAVSSFNYYSQPKDFTKWSSPDETANYIFAKLYAQESRLTLFEKYNLYADDIIRPRSVRSDHGKLKPVSFLGIILIYGTIAKFTTYKIIPFLTPLVGALGLVYFYLFVKKIFGKRNALLSVFLLSFFPPYVYYSARSMFHNILFAVLLLIGLYYLFSMRTRKNKISKRKLWLYPALSGLFLGLAVMTRTSELLWIAPCFALLAALNWRRLNYVQISVLLSACVLSLLPMFYYNQILYGAWFFGGYAEANNSIVTLVESGSELVKTTAEGAFSYYPALFERVKSSVFFFGFDPKQSLLMLEKYFTSLFPWLFWLSFLGFWILLSQIRRKKKSRWKHISYLAFLFTASAVLVFYYGSWEFYDNPDKTAVSVAASYTRYWLPIYMGAIPLASLFIMRLTYAVCKLLGLKNRKGLKFGQPRLNRNFALAYLRLAVIFSLVLPWAVYVVYATDDSLLYLSRRLRASRAEFSSVTALTEPNSVIITQYHDKLFFPERKVIYGLFDNVPMVQSYARLAGLLPVYYYNFTFPEKDIDYLNGRRLKENGLQIEPIRRITKDFTLYILNTDQPEAPIDKADIEKSDIEI